MLEITVPGAEWYDERTELFCYTKETTLRLEHSLISLSKWESKWNVPFYADEPAKTPEMMTDYTRVRRLTGCKTGIWIGAGGYYKKASLGCDFVQDKKCCVPFAVYGLL